MFKIKEGVNNLLGDVVIDGKLISNNDYYVSGRAIIKDIKVKNLYIFDTGHITGNIKADNIFNYGKLEGTINANEIYDNGEIQGDISAKKIKYLQNKK